MTDQVRVPDGHRVHIHAQSAEPRVERSRGGVLLADFGAAGDDPDRELATIFTAIEARGDVATLLVDNSRAVKISDLFAPSTPTTSTHQSPILWLFHDGGARSLCDSSERLARVIDRMSELRATTLQVVYIGEPFSHHIAALVGRVRDLGINIRCPGDQGAALAEVQRPDGRILSALVGQSFPVEQSDDADDLIPYRSPRLRQLLLDLQSSGRAGLDAVTAELKARVLPLLLITDQVTGGVSPRVFGNLTAIPAYTDVVSFKRAARETQARGYGIMGIAVRELFALAKAQGVVVALCAYRDDKPIYAVIPSL